MTAKWKNPSPEQTAYRWGLIIAAIAGVVLVLPGRESWHAAGPPNIGHARIDCSGCHTPAPGNFAGQTLRNMLHGVGLVDSGADFIFAPAGKEQCLACHENPDDRHPVTKFLEPEFAAARRSMGVQTCISCHREHLGIRVSVTPRVCQHCHEDTVLEDDPVDIPHTTLISEARWETCLGCHDFHGNHERSVPQMMSQALSEERIQQYFDGGASPYGYRRLTAIQTMRTAAEKSR